MKKGLLPYLLKFWTEVWDLRTKNAFIGIVHPRNAFWKGRSENRCNEARGPVMAVNWSYDASRGRCYTFRRKRPSVSRRRFNGAITVPKLLGYVYFVIWKQDSGIEGHDFSCLNSLVFDSDVAGKCSRLSQSRWLWRSIKQSYLLTYLESKRGCSQGRFYGGGQGAAPNEKCGPQWSPILAQPP